MRLDEGELYSATRLQRSRQRLINLQYFEEVKIDTKRRGEEELMDLRSRWLNVPQASLRLVLVLVR